MEIISYNFYEDYKDNKSFAKILQKRITEINNRYNLKVNDDELMKEYFVEVFSWSVLSKRVVKQIEKILKSKIILILDVE